VSIPRATGLQLSDIAQDASLATTQSERTRSILQEKSDESRSRWIGSGSALATHHRFSSSIPGVHPMKRDSGRMWYFVVGIVGVCLATGFVSTQWTAWGQEQAKPKQSAPPASPELHEGQPASVWMKKKLDYSKNILEGISLADFDKVSQNAKAMRSLSKFETFVRRGTPGYRAQADAFDRSLAELIRQADKENVEGMTLGFHQLTNSCVRCHRELREAHLEM
jgi:hypothetical protein